MRLQFALSILLALVFLGNLSAYYNVTFVNTTLVLYPNSSAHVTETFDLFISNSSVQQYIQSRNAVGLSLSDWQNILYTSQLTEHIINSQHSQYGFIFLPGPLITQYNGGIATLTMSYNVNNVTDVKIIAPRQFKYTFNDSVFNFENTAEGQALPSNERLNIIIPSQAYNVSASPLPDLPQPSSNNYKNITAFSWFSGEPLSQFSFSFIISESLQDEVLSYFSGVYSSYSRLIYATVVIVIIVIIAYVYLRVGRENTENKG